MIGIHVRALTRSFGVVRALAGASTSFEPGMLHGLIGPEGAGKTTLLRTVMGLLRSHSGDVRYESDGKAVTFDEIRSRVAYMPQQQSLYPDLSIIEHLEFFRELYGLSSEVYASRSEELLRITRLDRFKDRPAGKLSGGMYKKLGLMCALLQSPSVVLLDEPTNGVDPISRREFWELLYGLAEHQILIVISTAYMDEAERCDRVHLLESGRFIGSGPPHVLLERAGVASFDDYFIRMADEAAG